MDSKQNPETKYREGYEEGAWALYRQLEKFLPEPVSNDAADWLEKKLEPWRLSAQQAAAANQDVPKILPPQIQIPAN